MPVGSGGTPQIDVCATNLIWNGRVDDSARVNENFIDSLVIAATDTNGNIDIDHNQLVTLNTLSGSAVLWSSDSSGIVKSPVNGVARWKDLRSMVAEPLTITATSGILKEAVLPTVHVTAQSDGLQHGQIVISEFRPAGPGDSAVSSASDEYVELFNPTSTDILLNNQILVQRGNGSDNDAVVFTFSGENVRTIPAYGHLLIGKNMNGRKNPQAIQNVAVDGVSTLTTGLSSTGGGVALRNGTTGISGRGGFIDAMTYISNSGSGPLNIAEGTLIDLGSRTGGVTIERKPGYPSWNGFDTHSNAADFIVKGITARDAQPQNSTSDPTPPPRAAGSGYIGIQPTVVSCGASTPITLTINGDGASVLSTVTVTIPSRWTWSGRPEDINISGDGCTLASVNVTVDTPYQITILQAHITGLASGVLTLSNFSAPEAGGIDTFFVQTAPTGEIPALVSLQPIVRVDDFDGSGKISVTPSTVDAGIQTELSFVVSTDELPLSTVQFEISSEWGWNGQPADVVLSDSGFAHASFVVCRQANSVVITIDSATIINALTGRMTLMNITAPTIGGVRTIIVRTKATQGKILRTIPTSPGVTIIPRINYSIVPRYLVCDGTSGTPGTGTPSVVCAEIMGLHPATTYAYKIHTSDAHLVTWSWTDSSWGSDSKAYSQVSRFTTSDSGCGRLMTFVKCLSQTTPGGCFLMVRLRVIGDSVSTDVGFPIKITTLATGNVGWLQGHLFSDVRCENALCNTIVVVCDGSGIILATAMTENNGVREGNNPVAGYFRCAVPEIETTSIHAVAMDTPPAGHIRTNPPWYIIPGRTIDIDRTECRLVTCQDTALNAQPICFGTTGVRMRLRRISRDGYYNIAKIDTLPTQSRGCRYHDPDSEFRTFRHHPLYWQIITADTTNGCMADLTFSYDSSVNFRALRVAWRSLGDTTQWMLISRGHTQLDSLSCTITAFRQNPSGEWTLVEECGESMLPSSFHLLLPQDQSTIDPSTILFSWQHSMNNEKDDSISYTLLVYSNADSTSIAGIHDTTYSFIPTKLRPLVEYHWEVQAIGRYGTTPCMSRFTFYLQAPSAVSRCDRVPKEFFLSQNYPNPFNATTQLRYGLPIDARVRIEVFDILGRLVSTVIDECQKGGTYSAVIDCEFFSSGVYWIRMTTEKYTAVRKMVLMK